MANTTYVCFTGRGTYGGLFISRLEWSKMAARMGHFVTETVTGPHCLLVAARTDTKKARDAAYAGAPVVSYDEYMQAYRECETSQERAAASLESLRRIRSYDVGDTPCLRAMEMEDARRQEKARIQEEAAALAASREEQDRREGALRRALNI